MAITAGIYGIGESPDGGTAEDIWTKAEDKGSVTQWCVKVTGAAGIFRFYTGDTIATAFQLGVDESQEIGIRSGEFTRITFQGTSSSEVTWFPTVLMAK